jgi:urea transport system permease protein
VLYFVNAALLIGALLAGRWIQRSKLGTLLLAMRDKEDRVRFSGYDVAMFKVFVFCLAAMLAAVGGDVHAAGGLHVAVVRRHRAVDRDGDLRRRGRAHVAGRRGVRRAAGQLGKTWFSESFPNLWLF